MQDEVHEFSFANDLDQTRRLQFFNVMRQGRGAHIVGFVQHSARRRRVTRPDLLEDLIAPRLGQRTGNSRKLPVCELELLGRRHRFKLHENTVTYECASCAAATRSIACST